MQQETILIRLTYKYRLYQCAKYDKALLQQINVAGCIWNHALAVQRRYYRLCGGYICEARMKQHIARLRMKVPRYAWWRALGSQAVQDVLERLDAAYQRFFNKQGGLPRFRKVKRYKSFTLKQTAGWKLVCHNQNERLPNGKYRRSRGVVEIAGQQYKFIQHRPLFGTIKTVTIKRDSLERLWVCFSVILELPRPAPADLSHIGGFDFGLRTFLTDQTGKRYMAPEFFRQLLARIRALNRRLSRKVEGSHNGERARWLLARSHARIADKRRDFHFKLAHALCDVFDVLVFETLSMAAMKRRWGRKVSDLSFGTFLKILERVALLRGKEVVYIPRFELTTQKCSGCGARQDIDLKQRWFDCANPACGLSLDRDHNAAINIVRAGASARRPRGTSDLTRQAAP